jgi:hypothetical protein
VGEEVVGVDGRSRAARGDLLGGQEGVQFAERALVPAGGVFDVDDCADCGRGCGEHATVLDRDGCRIGRRLEEVPQ